MLFERRPPDLKPILPRNFCLIKPLKYKHTTTAEWQQQHMHNRRKKREMYSIIYIVRGARGFINAIWGEKNYEQ